MIQSFALKGIHAGRLSTPVAKRAFGIQAMLPMLLTAKCSQLFFSALVRTSSAVSGRCNPKQSR